MRIVRSCKLIRAVPFYALATVIVGFQAGFAAAGVIFSPSQSSDYEDVTSSYRTGNVLTSGPESQYYDFPLTSPTGHLPPVVSSVSDSNGNSATASANSISYSYSATSISAQGNLSASATKVTQGSNWNAATVNDFYLVFVVTQPEAFTVSSSLNGIEDFLVKNDTTNVYLVNHQRATGTFFDSGLFVPNDIYTLQVQAQLGAHQTNATGTLEISNSYNLTLEVPEPACGTLFCVGAIGLFARRRCTT